MNIINSKIWVGSDVLLKDRVVAKLKELGGDFSSWGTSELLKAHSFYVHHNYRVTWASADVRWGTFQHHNEYTLISPAQLLGTFSTKSLIDFGDED